MNAKQFSRETAREYKRFIRKEKKEFEKGNRDSRPATCEGNLW